MSYSMLVSVRNLQCSGSECPATHYCNGGVCCPSKRKRRTLTKYGNDLRSLLFRKRMQASEGGRFLQQQCPKVVVQRRFGYVRGVHVLGMPWKRQQFRRIQRMCGLLSRCSRYGTTTWGGLLRVKVRRRFSRTQVLARTRFERFARPLRNVWCWK